MIKIIRIFTLVASIVLAACGSSESPCPDSKCSDYRTQQEAQAAFDADPDCYRNLDADHDGMACEHLPK